MSNYFDHLFFIDKLLPESFQTTVSIFRVGMAHPDFFQGGRLPSAHPATHVPPLLLYRYKLVLYYKVFGYKWYAKMRISSNSAKLFFAGRPLLLAYNFSATMSAIYTTSFGGCGLPKILAIENITPWFWPMSITA